MFSDRPFALLEQIVRRFTTAILHNPQPILRSEQTGSAGVVSTVDHLEARVLLSGAATPELQEFQVNSRTNGDQEHPSVAINNSGASVIVWESPDGSGDGIYGQRYTADGLLDGPEFRINVSVIGDQITPEVALNDDSTMVVVWQQDDFGADAGEIKARVFYADGTSTSEIAVNTYTTGLQSEPVVALASHGGFFIAWTSFGQDGEAGGVYGRLFSFDGTPAGGEFRVNTYTYSDQSAPSISVSPQDRFVVAWQSLNQTSEGYDIYAQRYGEDGTAFGGEEAINAETIGDQTNPDVVAWGRQCHR